MNNHIDILASFEGQLEKIAADQREDAAAAERRAGRQAGERLGSMAGRGLSIATQAGRALAQSGDTVAHRAGQKLLGKNKGRKVLGIPVGKRLSKAIDRKRSAALGKTLGGLAMDAKHVSDEMKRDTTKPSDQG